MSKLFLLIILLLPNLVFASVDSNRIYDLTNHDRAEKRITCLFVKIN